jgi:glucose/arabinose dehydrogenase
MLFGISAISGGRGLVVCRAHNRGDRTGTSQDQQQALQAALDEAWAHIVSQPNCVSFLTGNSGVGYAAALTQLANTLSNTTYTFTPSPDPGAAATTNTLGGNQVTIDPAGAFFATRGGAGTVRVFGPNSQGTGMLWTHLRVRC